MRVVFFSYIYAREKNKKYALHRLTVNSLNLKKQPNRAGFIDCNFGKENVTEPSFNSFFFGRNSFEPIIEGCSR